MDTRKVKVDHLTLLGLSALYPQSGLRFEVEAHKICAKHFDNVYFIKFNSKLNEKVFGIKEKQ